VSTGPTCASRSEIRPEEGGAGPLVVSRRASPNGHECGRIAAAVWFGRRPDEARGSAGSPRGAYEERVIDRFWYVRYGHGPTGPTPQARPAGGRPSP